MSIASRIEQIEQHLTDDYSVLELAGADLTNVDKNIFNLKETWKERLLYFLANGTDVVWNNWLPKVTGTGETITLNNTIETKMDFVYKGNTSQTGTPTPDDPIPVQVVTGNNSIKIANSDNTQSQSYPINLGNIELCKIGDYQDSIKKSTGKNLFDKSTITTSTYLKEDGTLQTGTGAEYVTSDFIPVKPNTTYYKTQTLSPRTKFYDKNKQVLDSSTYQDISIGGNAGSFTTPNNAYYFRFTGNVNTSTGININTTMVNEGSSALPYEPYGVGWYLHKEIGKVVFNGSENWDKNDGASTSSGYYEFSTVLKNNTEQIDLLCDNFNVGTSYSSTKEQVRNRTDTRIYINILGTRLSTQDTNGFKIWLSNHNTTLYYQLSTPTNEEITDSKLIYQLEATKKSYNNQTNISQENSKEAFILDVTALGN